MGCIVNDDRSDETIRHEELEYDRVQAEFPDMHPDAAWDLAIQRLRERRHAAEVARDERQRNTLFGDIRS